MEKLDIIDKQGKLTNNTATRNEVHQKGLLHHASGLIIVRRINNNWEILSQQRSLNKEKNAGLWDMSASGHILSGESPILSLTREVKEELGISVNQEELFLLGKFWRNEVHNKTFIENELDYIFLLNKDIDTNLLKIQKDEVEDVKWIKLSEFKVLIDNKKAVARNQVWDELFKYLG